MKRPRSLRKNTGGSILLKNSSNTLSDPTWIHAVYLVGFGAFLTLALEILFAHLLSIVFGIRVYYSVYSLAILGLGIGSASAHWLRDRVAVSGTASLISMVQWCFMVMMVTAIAALWAQLNYGRLPCYLNTCH